MTSSGDSKKEEEPRKDGPRGNDDTHIVFKAEQRDQDTKIIPGGQLKPPVASSQEPAGAVVGIAKKPLPGRPANAPRDDATVFMPSRGGPRVTPTVQAGAAPAADATVLIPSGVKPSAGVTAQFDPVAGWLVVLEGPGKGNYRAVYYGQNSLGRGNDQRIPLDFGDQGISRDTHAFIVYDDVERKFYVRDNHKPNLVRLAGKPVMSPTELIDRQEIRIGDTTLLFVALCGSTFDWFVADGPGKS